MIVFLERDAQRLRGERTRILEALRDARRQLLDARQDEVRDVVFAGKAIRPIDAAKRVKAGRQDGRLDSEPCESRREPASFTRGSRRRSTKPTLAFLSPTNASWPVTGPTLEYIADAQRIPQRRRGDDCAGADRTFGFAKELWDRLYGTVRVGRVRPHVGTRQQDH